MLEAGYKRLTPHHDDEAVTWWFFESWEDGFAFARGGRCRTAREARKIIEGLRDRSKRDHREWLERPTHELLPDGEIRPLPDVGRPVLHRVT